MVEKIETSESIHLSSEEPLDPNLVKAMIFKESRVGNDSDGKLNIMQVGNPGDPSLDVLNNASKKPENELKNGNWQVDYSGMAKVNTVYDSIYWGVRMVIPQGQWIGSDKDWFKLKNSSVKLIRYSPDKEYVENVFNIYLDGVDKEGRVTDKTLAFLFFLFSSVFSLSCSIINIQLRLPY